MRQKTAQALALRARIVLTCAEGGQNKEGRPSWAWTGDRRKWRRRFVEKLVAGLHDEPRSGAPRTIDEAEAVIVRTLETCPENATHWVPRNGEDQRAVSVDGATHLAGLRTPAAPDGDVQALDDPNFVAKVRDVVGLYVSPPEHAIVLCVDQKSPIQALDRSQPMLPMRPASRLEGATATKGTAPHCCSLPSTSLASASLRPAPAEPTFNRDHQPWGTSL